MYNSLLKPDQNTVKLELQKIDNQDEIITNLRYVIAHSNIEDFIDEQDDKIINTQNQIKQLCEEHYKVMAKHFQIFQKIKQNIQVLQNSMQEIEKEQNIQKTSKMYDIAQLTKKRKTIENINKLLKVSKLCQKQILISKQAIENVKKDNFLAGIRNLYQLQQFDKIDHHLRLKCFSVRVKDIVPMIYSRIHKEQNLQIVNWVGETKKKQIDYGNLAYQNYNYIIKLLENQTNLVGPQSNQQAGGQQKISQILNISRDSKLLPQVTRISSINNINNGRNQFSTVRNTINQRKSQRSSFMQQRFTTNKSSMTGVQFNIGRNSIAAGFGFGGEEAKFLTNRSKNIVSKISQGNNNLKDQQIFTFNVKIDFSTLKQPQLVYESLSEIQIFFTVFKQNREQMLLEICDCGKLSTTQELQQYLQNIIGFFIVEKEINENLIKKSKINSKVYNYQDITIKAIKIIEKKIKIYYSNQFEELEFIPSKNIVYQFAYLLEILELTSASQSIIKLLQEQLVKYCDRMIFTAKKKLTEKIKIYSFDYQKVNNKQEYLMYTRIFSIVTDIEDDNSENSLNENINPLQKTDFERQSNLINKTYDLPFSSVLAIISELIEEYIDNCIMFLKGVNDTSNIIYVQLDMFYQEICSIFDYQILQSKPAPNAMQTCQIYNNLSFLQSSINYYQKKIEYLLKIKPNQNFKSLISMEQLKLRATDLVNNELTFKVNQFLSNYEDQNWNPKQPNNQANQFIQGLVEYLVGTFQSMLMIREDLCLSAIYPIFKHINDYLWRFLMNPNLEKINICSLKNLELDLIVLFQACGTSFSRYSNLMECLREIRQFLDIFFVQKDPETLLDSNCMKKYYNHLNMQKVIQILPKYQKIKFGNLPYIRKNKQVEPVLKKLKQDLGILK